MRAWFATLPLGALCLVLACQTREERPSRAAAEASGEEVALAPAPTRVMVRLELGEIPPPEGKSKPWQPKFVVAKFRDSDTGRFMVRRFTPVLPPAPPKESSLVKNAPTGKHGASAKAGAAPGKPGRGAEAAPEEASPADGEPASAPEKPAQKTGPTLPAPPAKPGEAPGKEKDAAVPAKDPASAKAKDATGKNAAGKTAVDKTAKAAKAPVPAKDPVAARAPEPPALPPPPLPWAYVADVPPGDYTMESLRLTDGKKGGRTWTPDAGARAKVRVTVQEGQVLDLGRWAFRPDGAKKLTLAAELVKAKTEDVVAYLRVSAEQHIAAWEALTDEEGGVGSEATALGAYQFRQETTMFLTVQLLASRGPETKRLSDALMTQDEAYRGCYRQRLPSLPASDAEVGFLFALAKKEKALSRIRIAKRTAASAYDKPMAKCLRNVLAKVAFDPAQDLRGKLTFRFSSGTSQQTRTVPVPHDAETMATPDEAPPGEAPKRRMIPIPGR